MLTISLKHMNLSDWRHPAWPIWKTFSFMKPHCAKARAYRQVDGKYRYTCDHMCDGKGGLIE